MHIVSSAHQVPYPVTLCKGMRETIYQPAVFETRRGEQLVKSFDVVGDTKRFQQAASVQVLVSLLQNHKVCMQVRRRKHLGDDRVGFAMLHFQEQVRDLSLLYLGRFFEERVQSNSGSQVGELGLKIG